MSEGEHQAKFVAVYLKSAVSEAFTEGMRLPFVISMSGEGPGEPTNVVVGRLNRNGTMTILSEALFQLPVDITVVDVHGKHIHTHVPALGLRSPVAESEVTS
jgi:hypothetical protein